jgi:hypothetical protein
MSLEEEKIRKTAELEINDFNARRNISLETATIIDRREFGFPRIQLEKKRIESAGDLINNYEISWASLFNIFYTNQDKVVVPIILVEMKETLIVVDGAHRLYRALKLNKTIDRAWYLRIDGIYPPFPYTINSLNDVIVEDNERPRKQRYDWIEGREFLDISTPIDNLTHKLTLLHVTSPK